MLCNIYYMKDKESINKSIVPCLAQAKIYINLKLKYFSIFQLIETNFQVLI